MWRSWNSNSDELKNDDFFILDNLESFPEETDFPDAEIALEEFIEDRLEDIF